jgi:hypothetical protein
MDTTRQNTDSGESRSNQTVVHTAASRNADLPDSPHDAERLKPEETILDLPDVSDIPGQEHVQAPPLGALADTTISSADEEGEGLFDDTPANDDFIPGVESDGSKK